MTKHDKQRIREAALLMDKPFTVQTLKNNLTDLVFSSRAPKSREWRNVLEEMITEGLLAVHAQGERIPLGGTEGGGRRREYKKPV